MASETFYSAPGTSIGMAGPPQDKTLEQRADQMRAALEEIRGKAGTMPNGGMWAAGLATLCLGTL